MKSLKKQLIENTLSVFGGTGFIGSNFIKHTNQKCIVQPRESRNPFTNNIIYFISTVNNYNIYSNITLDVETNLVVLCEVLNHCKNNNFTFNFISSWVVYGDCELPASEESTCSPKGFYSITKKAAEDLLISFCMTFDVKYRIIRLCNVLGKGDSKVSARKNAITHMINQLKNNETVTLYDKGSNLRDIMHISDVSSAIDLICSLGKTNQIYNISSGKSISIKEIITKAKYKIKSSSTLLYSEPSLFEKNIQTRNIVMNSFKLKDLGFEQKYNLDEILNELCF